MLAQMPISLWWEPRRSVPDPTMEMGTAIRGDAADGPTGSFAVRMTFAMGC